MIELKNTGRSPRVVYDVRGRAVVVEPGATKSINITDETAAMLVRRGVFEIVKTEDAPKEIDQELEALRADADGLGIKVNKRWKAERLQQEIDNALRDTDSEPATD